MAEKNTLPPPPPQRRTIVVVTASNDKQAAAVETELAARRKSGAFGPDVLLYAVPDPSSARVGSGGATFNALVTVQELVSASMDIRDCLVICIHSGGDSQRMYTQSVCGKAWSSLPSLSAAGGELDAPIDLLLTCMLRIFSDVKAGLVVASSDVLLLIPESFYPAPGRPSHWAERGATGLAIPTDKHLGPNHGVYHCATAPAPGSQVARVSKFFQKASVPEMAAAGAVRSDDKVLIDTGVIYFSAETTGVLLELARMHPLDSCTYAGLDCGRPALRIELYSDIMMAMDQGLGLTLSAYLQVASSEARAAELAEARNLMWAQLSAAPFYAAVVEGGDFAHVGTTLEYLQLLTAPTPTQRAYALLSRAAWFAEGARVAGLAGCEEEGSSGSSGSGSSSIGSLSGGASPAPQQAHSLQLQHPHPHLLPPAPAATSCVQNSLFATPGALGSGSVVEHSVLTGDWRIGSGCLVSSVRTLQSLIVRDGIAVQELGMGGGGRCVTVLGCRDPIKDPFTKPSARVCGVPWEVLFEAMALGGLPGDGAGRAPGSAARDAIWGRGVWDSPSKDTAASCTLWTARLWPLATGSSLRASSASSSALVDSLRLGGYGDPVSPDKAALWLQWLAPEAGSSLPSTPSLAQAQRAAHVDARVIQAWLNAQRLSLRDILGAAEASAEFAWRRSLRGNIDCALLVCSIAQDSSFSCADLVRRVGNSATPSNTRLEGAAGTAADAAASSSASSSSSSGGAEAAAALHATAGAQETFAHAALRRLDAIAASAPPNIAGRALAVQSALLWAMAGWGVHGHRSGPAYNAQWLPALSLLDADAHAGGRGGEPGSRQAAVAQLAALRREWCSRAHLTGRAARHYERAAQLLTAQCVYTAPVAHPAPAPTAAAMPPLGAWTAASAPVRIDLAGGWSDTPPITYEAHSLQGKGGVAGGSSGVLSPALCAAAGGGLVVNAGILLDGVRSLGARVRRVARAPGAPLIVVRTRGLKRLGGGGHSSAASSSPTSAAAAASQAEFFKGLSDSGSSSGGAAAAAAAPPLGSFAELHAATGGAPGEVLFEESISSLGDLADYNQPHAKGALVKCALLCLKMVKLAPPGTAPAAAAAFPTLEQQLDALCGGASGSGLEVETWSLVPMGSGLGTSSILAGTVLAALGAALGRPYTRASLCHLVLIVEQMLTTGGGWQDQVGGLWPGLKTSWCASALPVQVRVFPLSPALQGSGGEEEAAALTPPALCEELDGRLFLLYTGRTRLAKHLLQRVLRQWAVRENGITSTVENLRATAAGMAAALAGCDMGGVGRALDAYWGQKKDMAPLAEPVDVTHMLEALRPHILGASLCGAGGGGFLVGLTAVAAPWEARFALLSAALRSCTALSAETASDWRLHRCSIDRHGLQYHK